MPWLAHLGGMDGRLLVDRGAELPDVLVVHLGDARFELAPGRGPAWWRGAPSRRSGSDQAPPAPVGRRDEDALELAEGGEGVGQVFDDVRRDHGVA